MVQQNLKKLKKATTREVYFDDSFKTALEFC